LRVGCAQNSVVGIEIFYRTNSVFCRASKHGLLDGLRGFCDVVVACANKEIQRRRTIQNELNLSRL
jgi:hypothetical protein